MSTQGPPVLELEHPHPRDGRPHDGQHPRCVQCSTAAPAGMSRVRAWPVGTAFDAPRGGRNHAQNVANRAELRRMGQYPTALRGATRRARTTAAPGAVRTEYGRVIRPQRPRSTFALAKAAQRKASKAPRATRAQRLADLRTHYPQATRSTLRRFEAFNRAEEKRRAAQ